jgi:hypothetical protein
MEITSSKKKKKEEEEEEEEKLQQYITSPQGTYYSPWISPRKKKKKKIQGIGSIGIGIRIGRNLDE